MKPACPRSIGGAVTLLWTAALLGGCSIRAGSGGLPPASITQLEVTHRVDHLGGLAREPMVAEHPNGTLFVSGYGGLRPNLWRSTDRGVTWTRVDVGGEARGAIGNSDVDLAVAADGTLYFLNMHYDRTASEGRQISIGVSRNVGATWAWTMISKVRYDDRPWVEVAPDGAAHIVWNDGSGVSHVMTRDRGATWSTRTRIHDKGGSSHLAVGPKGEVAVRITPTSASGRTFHAGIELIALSVDRGVTWQKQPAPGRRDWAPMGTPGFTDRWVEPIAWDEAGGLYSLWTDPSGVHLARSADRAKTWTTWTIARMPGSAFYPYLIARGRGQLAATWFSATSPTREDLKWQAALIDVPDGDARPRVIQSSPQAQETWRKDPGSNTLYRDPGGEYIGLTFLRAGGIGLATTIQNDAQKRMGFTWWKLEAR